MSLLLYEINRAHLDYILTTYCEEKCIVNILTGVFDWVLNLVLVIFLLPSTACFLMSYHGLPSWNNSVAFNQRTYKNNINSSWLAPEWEDWTWKHISARECLFYLKTHSWCVITRFVCVCVCVGELVDFVYCRGKRNAGVACIKTDRPIWKQSSNVSWKNRYVMAQGTSRLCQHQYFPSRLAVDFVLTGLMCIEFLSSLQVVFPRAYSKMNNCPPYFLWHTCTIQSLMWSTNRDKREEEFYQCHLLQIGSSGN